MDRAIRQRIWPAVLLAAFLLLLPIILYVRTFGPTLSGDHTRWGEFGSAMSGIYSPIIAVVTLIVLAMQVALQSRQVELQKQINEHGVDQDYIQQARADLEFYVIQVHTALGPGTHYGNTIREILLDRFQPANAQTLGDEQLRLLASELDRIEPRCLALWFAIYPILVGFASGTGAHFEVNKTASMQKLIAILGFEACVSLDNFHHIRTSGSLKGAIGSAL
jgi:uncharacterized membrane protein